MSTDDVVFKIYLFEVLVGTIVTIPFSVVAVPLVTLYDSAN